MADATRGYLHQHLCAFRLIEVDLFDFQGSVVLVEYCGFHGVLLFLTAVGLKSCGILGESPTSQQALLQRRSLAGFRTQGADESQTRALAPGRDCNRDW